MLMGKKVSPPYLPTVPSVGAANKKPNMDGNPLTVEESAALISVSNRLNINPMWLYTLILHESGWYALSKLYRSNGQIHNGSNVAVGLNQINSGGLATLKQSNPTKYKSFTTQQQLIQYYNTRLLQINNTVYDFFHYQLNTVAHTLPKTYARFYLLNWLPSFYNKPAYQSDNTVVPEKYWQGSNKTLAQLANAAIQKETEMPYSVNVNGGSVEPNTTSPEEAPPVNPPKKKKPTTPKPKKQTHYSGKLKKGVDDVVTQASSVGGVFYSIFNKYNFYDVADIKNGLSPEQRAQVPQVNQQRFTDMSNAIAEMFHFILGDKQYGVLVNHVQDAVDKLDMRASANAAQLNTIGAGLAAVGPVPIIGQYLAGIDSARRVAEQTTVTAMGGNLAMPEMIPAYSVPNFPNISPIGNLLEHGFIKPDFDFIYKYETIKSPTIYSNNGQYYIGTQIPLYENPDSYQIVLKYVFGVVGVDGSMNPIGSPLTGISSDYYNTLVAVAPAPVGTLSTNLQTKANAVKLSETQLKASFTQWYMYKFWNQLNDSGTALYSHWGFLTNNNLPANIRTAVASFVWSTKAFTLTPGENDVAAYVSYFVQMGLYYSIGYSNPVRLSGGTQALYIDANHSMQTVPVGSIITAPNGVPKMSNIADTYYAWAAITIMLMTTSNPQIEDSYRTQRIAEALLIFKSIGVDVKNLTDKGYGTIDASTFTSYVNYTSYAQAIAESIYRYNNTSSAGVVNGGSLAQNSSGVSVTFQSQVQKTDTNGWVLPGTIDKLKQLATLAGITEVNISQTVQTATELASYLYNLQENGIVLQYAPPTQRVISVYSLAKTSNVLADWDSSGNIIATNTPAGLSKSYAVGEPVSAEDATIIINLMVNQINIEGAYSVSKHATESIDTYHLTQVLDVSPTGSKPVSAIANFKSRLKEIASQQDNQYHLTQYTDPTPNNESGMHLEFSGIGGTEASSSAALPDVLFNSINNAVYNSTAGWASVFIADTNRVKAAGNQ